MGPSRLSSAKRDVQELAEGSDGGEVLGALVGVRGTHNESHRGSGVCGVCGRFPVPEQATPLPPPGS